MSQTAGGPTTYKVAKVSTDHHHHHHHIGQSSSLRFERILSHHREGDGSVSLGRETESRRGSRREELDGGGWPAH